MCRSNLCSCPGDPQAINRAVANTNSPERRRFKDANSLATWNQVHAPQNRRNEYQLGQTLQMVLPLATVGRDDPTTESPLPLRAHRIHRKHPTDLVWDESTNTQHTLAHARENFTLAETNEGVDKWFSNDDDLQECDYCDQTITDDREMDCCEQCHAEHFYTCEECDESGLDINYGYYDDDSCEMLCERCFHERITQCDDCGENINRDHSVSINGADYCEDCSHHHEGFHDCKFESNGVCDVIGSTRKFGVELETSESDSWQDWHDSDAFKVVPDGSTNGMEWVSAPMQGDDGLAEVMRVTNQLDRNCRVDDSTGMHLHCDLSDTDKQQRKAIALAYHLTVDIWHSMIAAERNDTGYSQKTAKYYNAQEIVNCDTHSGAPRVHTRYTWINWQAFAKHGTVELRCHHGTTDAREVATWVKAHLRFIDAVRTMTTGQVMRTFNSGADSDALREFNRMVGPRRSRSAFRAARHRLGACERYAVVGGSSHRTLMSSRERKIGGRRPH